MSIAEGVLNLILSLVLVERFGTVGVALGTLLAAILTSAWYTPFYCCKVMSIKFNKYFVEVILKNAIVAAFFIIILALQKRFFYSNGIVELMILFIIDFLIFGSLTYGLALNKLEKTKLREALLKFIKLRSGVNLGD
jgi:O-antigen/teichoic acid export membrane protein